MTLSILGSGTITTENSSIQLSGSSIIIPRGNTANRPVPAVTGMIRFNEDTRVFELYGGNTWLNVSQPANVTLELIVVAGGGGSSQYGTGDGVRGAGGGAGGVIVGNVSLGPVTAISVSSIGAGGGGGQTSLASSNGSNTTISLVGKSVTTLTAIGGGYGGYTPFNGEIGNGGCGGGCGGFNPSTPNTGEFRFGGNGIIGQGFAGGAALRVPGGVGGGGGGAGQAGGNTSPTTSGFGGNGYLWLNGRFYSGGGAAFGFLGGRGGGGHGQSSTASNGNVNTGGGGGQPSNGTPTTGSGGSGVILLAHSNIITNAIISSGLTVTVNTQVIPGSYVYEITGGTGVLSWPT